MKFLRTPDCNFKDLVDFDYGPNYLQVSNGLRMHYLDEGPEDAPTLLLLHGEPSWCYLYRHMIPVLLDAGFRILAPDLIGFGRSDKPVAKADYTFANHLRWLGDFKVAKLPEGSHVFCQDWGGLLALRLVAEDPSCFASVITCNTFLPTGLEPTNPIFEQWRELSQQITEFPSGGVVQMGCIDNLAPEVIAAYNAPFPSQAYTVGARVFPLLVPSHEDEPEAINNQLAWRQLMRFEKPFLTLFGDGDPITAGCEKVFQQLVPGCQGQPHEIIADAGHFAQEEKGAVLAEKVVAFLKTDET